MNLALLGCDDVPQRFRHIAGGYRDMFEKVLAPHMPDLSLTWIDLYNGETPPSPADFDAFVCTGSRCSVYEDRPWINGLKAFVREAQAADVPFVGICFGHQMLAEALGGKVERADYGWGIGVHGMQILKPEEWMVPERETCRLQYMHADQVQRLPEGSTLLASAAHCPVAMFRVGERMLGIEGHPEFPAAFEQALLLDRRERIGIERVDAALATVNESTDEDIVGAWIAGFLRHSAGPRA
jgi:GMP synthase-like glutamine amidotransferase